MSEYDEHTIDDPSRFLKCPSCHRTTTTEITVHADGDFTIECTACGAMAFGHKLHTQDRTYE